MVTALGMFAGCGNPPSIVGNWGNTTTPLLNLQTEWTFKFTADNKFSLDYVAANRATSGQGAGCVKTLSLSGAYTASEPDLTVTAQSGTWISERCQNSAENTPAMTISAANLAVYSMELSGMFTVGEDQLTLPMPPLGVGPGVLTRK